MQPFDEEWIRHYAELEKQDGIGEKRPWVLGKYHYRQRLIDVCNMAVSRFAGDVLEIGVYGGATSIGFAPICQRNSRKLILIDPWEDDGAGLDTVGLPKRVAEVFAPFGNTVEIHRLRSQGGLAVKIIKEHAFAFAFIDGSHLSADFKIDLENVVPITRIIAVDDWFFHDISQTAKQYAKDHGLNVLAVPEFGEAYLFK